MGFHTSTSCLSFAKTSDRTGGSHPQSVTTALFGASCSGTALFAKLVMPVGVLENLCLVALTIQLQKQYR